MSGRRRAVAVAGHKGDESTARLGLTDPDPEVRATAIGALARLGALSPGDIEVALTDDAPGVRRRACEAAAAMPGAAPSLLEVLADDEPSVVEVAAWASGERQPPEQGVVAVLCRLTEAHSDALVREAAVAALGAIGDRSGLESILRATQDRPAVRRRAVIALAPFEGPEVDAALARALGDRDWQVRQAAEDLTRG